MGGKSNANNNEKPAHFVRAYLQGENIIQKNLLSLFEGEIDRIFEELDNEDYEVEEL